MNALSFSWNFALQGPGIIGDTGVPTISGDCSGEAVRPLAADIFV